MGKRQEGQRRGARSSRALKQQSTAGGFHRTVINNISGTEYYHWYNITGIEYIGGYCYEYCYCYRIVNSTIQCGYLSTLLYVFITVYLVVP